MFTLFANEKESEQRQWAAVCQKWKSGCCTRWHGILLGKPYISRGFIQFCCVVVGSNLRRHWDFTIDKFQLFKPTCPVSMLTWTIFWLRVRAAFAELLLLLGDCPTRLACITLKWMQNQPFIYCYIGIKNQRMRLTLNTHRIYGGFLFICISFKTIVDLHFIPNTLYKWHTWLAWRAVIFCGCFKNRQEHLFIVCIRIVGKVCVEWVRCRTIYWLIHQSVKLGFLDFTDRFLCPQFSHFCNWFSKFSITELSIDINMLVHCSIYLFHSWSSQVKRIMYELQLDSRCSNPLGTASSDQYFFYRMLNLQFKQ